MKIKTLTKIFASVSLGAIAVTVPLVLTTSCSDTTPATIKNVIVTPTASINPIEIVKNEGGAYEIPPTFSLFIVKGLQKIAVVYDGKMNTDKATQPAVVMTLKIDGKTITDSYSFDCTTVTYNETTNLTTIEWNLDETAKALLKIADPTASYDLEFFVKAYKDGQDSSNGVASGAKIVYSYKVTEPSTQLK